VPAAQLPWERQTDWLSPLEYWPPGQALQVRSTVADGVSLTNVPAGQVDHGAQAGALTSELNEPLTHVAQTRSVVAVPSVATDVPGKHDDLATHGVAELRSLSQVSAVQATGVAVPPAQYWPGEQAAQIAGEVAVPEDSCSVPAAQVPCG
jgi:hypothetical protein